MANLCIKIFLMLLVIKNILCDIGIKFTRQPEPIDAPFYDDIEFECSLNVPPEKVEWVHNGVIIENPGEKTGSSKQVSYELTISFKNISQVGYYQCIAWYGASALISIAAKLNLVSIKQFTEQPNESFDVSTGNDVIINCPSPESTPTAYIQYYKDNSLLTNANILQTTNSLFLKSANTSDSGAYSCLASNQLSGEGIKAPFKIDLKVTNTYRLTKSPYFLKPPQKHYTVEMGNNVSIECNAVGTPVPKIYWSKSDFNEFTQRFIQENTLLTITNVQPSDSGTYVCKADNDITPTLSYNIELEVQESPKLLKEPETAPITENETKTFECLFKGIPSPKIEWYHNGKLLVNDYNVQVNEGKLKISRVEKRHAGFYQCFGTNVLGSVYGITMMQVIPTQKEIFSSSSDDNILEDIKMFNESHHHHHNHEGKKHKGKHHGGKNKHGKENVVMIPPTRPNITRLNDNSVMVRWSVPPNNGLAIQFFKVQYKEVVPKNSRKSARWMTTSEDIPPHIRSFEVDGLETNQTYRFRIAAVYSNNDNKLGPNSSKFFLHKGSNTNKNKPKPPSLTSYKSIGPNTIEIEWQYLNSVLSPVDGFYIYYRATSTAGDYSKSTVEGQDVRAYNITHLQPDTPYEIKLQSFTVGAASDFSSIITERTLVDPNATVTTESTTDVTTPNPDVPNNTSGTSSKTYYMVIVGVIIGLIAILSLLYLGISILREKTKRENDEDSNDNDKIDSLTIPQNITDSTSTMNGFVHDSTHSILQLQNGNIHNDIPPNTKTAKLNGKISNGYINKTLLHTNNVHHDEDDETLNMISTSSGLPDLKHPQQQSPPSLTGIRDLKPLPRNINRDINQMQERMNMDYDSREFEALNMIQGIHEMNPGTREAINIINNPLENNNDNNSYNIELNYLSCLKNNNRHNNNNISDSTNNLRMKHKINNNNNNSKLINNNTKYSQNNNNNWRGRSVVDTRRTDNYM